VVATAATSIRKLMHAHEKRARLWSNARRLHAGLRDLGFVLGTAQADSAIIAVILQDQQRAVGMWQSLLDQGLYVNVARPPATPSGTFLLRCSLSAEHSDAQIDLITDMFAAAGRATGEID
jgi:7-keto-8-aminopelargonate synthetase-like enzyme